MNTKFLFAGLFFISILLSGFILSRAGRPINVFFLTVHKLISVGVVVFLAITVYRINQVTPLNSLEIAACVITLAFFITLVATGGLLSTAKTMPTAILKVHQIMPYLAIISTGISLYLLLTHRQ